MFFSGSANLLNVGVTVFAADIACTTNTAASRHAKILSTAPRSIKIANIAAVFATPCALVSSRMTIIVRNIIRVGIAVAIGIGKNAHARCEREGDKKEELF